MAPSKKTQDGELSEHEAVELELKRLQIEVYREQIAERDKKIENMRAEAARRITDQKALDKMRENRRRTCRHRKGGRNNNFAKGNAPDYSLAANTYPDGRVVIMCTRCQSEWEKPPIEMRRKDSAKYKELMADFRRMAELPTDNAPSGSQIFLIEKVAA